MWLLATALCWAGISALLPLSAVVRLVLGGVYDFEKEKRVVIWVGDDEKKTHVLTNTFA